MTSEQPGPALSQQLLLSKISAALILTKMVSILVDDEACVHVESETTEIGITFHLHVAANDVGKVIGKESHIARSIRTILNAIGSKQGMQYDLEIAASPVTLNGNAEQIISPKLSPRCS